MFKRIVCPVGLAPDTYYAVPTAAQLADLYGAELILLHLDDRFLSETEMVMLRTSVADKQEEFRLRAVEEKASIEAIANGMDLKTAVTRVVLREGFRERDIPREAEDLGADLIVVHSSGRNTMVEHVVGSTSESILKHARISVLVLFRK
ncbi:MAG: universal stress protein [Calditrichaeota bacterium]|nr:universal stress protein [Calditrichota bacterium]